MLACSRLPLCTALAVLCLLISDTQCFPRGGPAFQRHKRRPQMLLFLENETIPHDNPLVSDSGVEGNELPPRLTLTPLTLSELLIPPTHEYLAMCVVSSEDGTYVREWILHYLALGVGRIYLYDHRIPPITQAIEDLVAQGKVEYASIPNKGSAWRQFLVYEHCLQANRLRHHWIAFFDSDEFLVLKPPAPASLATFLKPFEPFGGLAVNWRIVGSSNHFQRPNASVVDSYTMCAPPLSGINEHVKTIVNTRFAASHAFNPHAFLYVEGKFVVNELRQRIPTESILSQNGAVTVGAISTQFVALFHYVTKSIEDYTGKVVRGSINRTPYKTLYWFQEVDAMCTEVCNEAVEQKARWANATGTTAPLPKLAAHRRS